MSPTWTGTAWLTSAQGLDAALSVSNGRITHAAYAARTGAPAIAALARDAVVAMRLVPGTPWAMARGADTDLDLIRALTNANDQAATNAWREGHAPLAHPGEDANEPRALRPGVQTLATFVIDRMLGRQRHGILYEGHHPDTTRGALWLEFAPPGCSRNGQGHIAASRRIDSDALGRARKRWRDTATARARIKHPALAPLGAPTEWNGHTGIAIEALGERMTLAERPPTPDDAAALVARLCAGVMALHNTGLVHGDIEERTLRNDGAGQIRLGPLAEPPSTEPAPLWQMRHRFHGPEAAILGRASAAGDAYALACACTEVLTGMRVPSLAQWICDIRADEVERHAQSILTHRIGRRSAEALARARRIATPARNAMMTLLETLIAVLNEARDARADRRRAPAPAGAASSNARAQITAALGEIIGLEQAERTMAALPAGATTRQCAAHAKRWLAGAEPRRAIERIAGEHNTPDPARAPAPATRSSSAGGRNDDGPGVDAQPPATPAPAKTMPRAPALTATVIEYARSRLALAIGAQAAAARHAATDPGQGLDAYVRTLGSAIEAHDAREDFAVDVHQHAVAELVRTRPTRAAGHHRPGAAPAGAQR